MSDSRPSPALAAARIEERFPSERFPEVVALYLYGSEATGSAHVDSDVDVAALLNREIVPRRGYAAVLSRRGGRPSVRP